MGARVIFSVEVQLKGFEMSLSGIPVREVLVQQNIRNLISTKRKKLP